MRELKYLYGGENQTSFRAKSIVIFFLGVLMLLTDFQASGQGAQLIQLKVLNEALEPYGLCKVSINGGDFIATNEKGVAFIDIQKYELPIKSIDIADQKLEAAFWNLSKGFLEITIRNKNYFKVTVLVKNTQNKILKSQNITFKGSKTITTMTDSKGSIQLPLPLNEQIKDEQQFIIEGYVAESISTIEETYVLIVKEIEAIEEPLREKVTSQVKYIRDFDISKLDSIESLTVFYSVIKNYQIEKLSPEIQQKIDNKFQQLVGELQDSLKRNVVTIISNISDSTYVQDDIKNLKEQAEKENTILIQQREEFAEKINLVNSKLALGLDEMDLNQRAALLDDINALEELLNTNENMFYKNQNSYYQVIQSLKDRFFDIEQLEGKLSGSEAKRLEEQQIFKEKMMAISVVVLVFALLIVLLIYFSYRLKKQKKALAITTIEVQHINENLETIVSNRTKLLEETFRELDTVLYRASHDLRAPVRSMQGLCNLAQNLSAAPNEIIERMLATNNGMDKMLKKLSVISEIHRPGDFSIVYNKDIIKNTRAHFEPLILEHNIKFTVNCPGDLTINTIPNLLEIILANLLENAIYYCLLKGSNEHQISLDVYNRKGYLYLILVDNGVGIEKSVKNKLFDMFYKGNEYSSGNGLGLYIVKKSVQVLNGRIKVDSELGKFSRFEIKLPLEGAEEYTFGFLQNPERLHTIQESSEQY